MTHNFKLLLDEANKLGLEINILYPEKEVVEISDGTRKILVRETFSIVNDPSSASITLAKNKEITYCLWGKMNVPFAKNRYFKDMSSFPKDASELRLCFPVVYKKSNGKKSIGVRTNITSFYELKKIATAGTGSFIVQEMVFGKEYRILLYDNSLLGALEMIPPKIRGDGIHTVEQLIQKKNANLSKKIVLNEKVLKTLDKNNLSLDSIPEEDVSVFLQENSCLAEGGSSVDCTDRVHKDILTLAQISAQSLNLKLAGIDIICEDISLDPNKQKISFLEANSLPSLDIHYNPTVGKPRRVIQTILKDIFQKI